MRMVLLDMLLQGRELIPRHQQVARMSAAICGDQDWFPDVASLIRATLAGQNSTAGAIARAT
jgi:hypothetical protein